MTFTSLKRFSPQLCERRMGSKSDQQAAASPFCYMLQCLCVFVLADRDTLCPKYFKVK